MSHKSHLTVELACLGVIIGSGVVAATFHGSRILAQHNDVCISKSNRHQILRRDSPLYVSHERALEARRSHYSVQEDN